MSELNDLFRKRIGFSENEIVEFEGLTQLLVKIALALPFENMGVINKNTRAVTEEELINKILRRNEGGLCYELNPLLYLFLKENGFQVSLVRGVVFNQAEQSWSTSGRTHVAILLTYEQELYLLDTGFGGNLPLTPVPLAGETVNSENGQFRVKQTDNQYGNHLFEMKRKYRDDDWTIGYVFNSLERVNEWDEIVEIQKIIEGSSESSFNKKPLLTKRTADGSITLTDTSCTILKNGVTTKESLDEEGFKERLGQYFGIYE